MNARIGIFGGSFDPVHNAHLALARTALTELPLDGVLWVPAGQPWQKTRELSAAAHRVAMLHLAIDGEPRFTLDRREIDRTGPSYTLDTVRELRAEWPDALLFLIRLSIGRGDYGRARSYIARLCSLKGWTARWCVVYGATFAGRCAVAPLMALRRAGKRLMTWQALRPGRADAPVL